VTPALGRHTPRLGTAVEFTSESAERTKLLANLAAPLAKGGAELCWAPAFAGVSGN